jgi:hypothetical protein
VKRILKGLELQPPAPKLDECQARLSEIQIFYPLHLGKALQAVVRFISTDKQPAEMGGFCGGL